MERTDDPALNGVVAAARVLAAEIAQRSQEIEAARTLPADVVGRFRQAGLFDLALPASLGGLECPPLTILEIVAEMSRADPSAGWTLLIGQGSGFLAWLPPEVAKEIVAETPHPVVASSMAPAGRGVETADGFRVTGRWPFASGCSHSDWLMAGFSVAGEAVPPVRRMGFFRSADVQIIDTWRTLGLRGTGSHDVAVQDAPVPGKRTFDPWADLSREPGPLYGASMMSFLMMMMAGFPLGVGRRALEEFRATAHRKIRQPSGKAMAEEALVQVAVLRCESALQAARALLVETINALAESVRAHGAAPLPVRARLAAAVVHAMTVACEVVDTAFQHGGASVLYESHPLQRCFRDIHAAAQHVAFGQETRKRLGRAELGLPVPAFLI
jgi:alkylation response protein AidB-like acyl-CoA dehydrogenase